MGYHQLLVGREGHFVVPLKVAPWWPTLQNFHAVVLLCVPLRELERSTTTASWLHWMVVLRSYSAAGVLSK